MNPEWEKYLLSCDNLSLNTYKFLHFFIMPLLIPS